MRLSFDLNVDDYNLQLRLSRTTGIWDATDDGDCLAIASGRIDDTHDGMLICQTHNEPIMTLIGASWDSNEGATGNARCDGCGACPTEWTWVLSEKSS